MTEGTEATDQTDDEFILPRDLIAKWFEIPANQPVEIEMPRVAFDMLYTGIEQSYIAQTVMMKAMFRLIVAVPNAEVEFDSLYDEMKVQMTRGLNGLRHFQAVVMMGATDFVPEAMRGHDDGDNDVSE